MRGLRTLAGVIWAVRNRFQISADCAPDPDSEISRLHKGRVITPPARAPGRLRPDLWQARGIHCKAAARARAYRRKHARQRRRRVRAKSNCSNLAQSLRLKVFKRAFLNKHVVPSDFW
ncbi:hypothetical protein NDU88_001107 [Pleurodeles waltl]|uniref:Uncharacterized protein n=1 Tax=Pleurodeles waltl TaxID=8319 RepID=A0AAV7VY27_PLEWA|nr:hypothetical protein NDU88_001107 [Pleurodeles waltl]